MHNYIFHDFLRNQNKNSVQIHFEIITFFSKQKGKERKETADFEEKGRLEWNLDQWKYFKEI